MISATVNLYRNAYTGLSRRMWLLSVVMLINRSGTMVLAFLTLYCRHAGYSEKQAGYAVAVYGLGSIVGAFLGGKISDRFGFYYTQFFSLFFGGLLFITLGQMNSFTSICLCTFFLSMVNESFRPANATAVAHYSTPQNRTQSFSRVRLAINMGWGVGGALGGILSEIDFSLLFWVDGLTNIVAAFLMILLLPKVSLAQQKNLPKAERVTAKAAAVHSDKTFMYFLLLQVLFALCFFQLFTSIPIYFNEGLHLNKSYIGLVLAMNGVLIAVLEMVMVFKLEGTMPYLRLMMIGTLLMGASFLVLNIPQVSGYIISMAAMLVITFAEMVAMPFMNSYYISRSSEGNRGQYAAFYTMAWSTAQVIGSVAGMQIAYAAGFRNLWWIIAAVCLVTAVGYNRMLHRKR